MEPPNRRRWAPRKMRTNRISSAAENVRIKLYVSFVTELYKRDDILQKRRMILRSLLIRKDADKAYLQRCRECARMFMWLLRSGDSLYLQISFVKEPYKTDDIPHKRPMILRSLLIVATPYPHLFDHQECLPASPYLQHPQRCGYRQCGYSPLRGCRLLKIIRLFGNRAL